MPIGAFLSLPSLTRVSPASNVGQDTQASNTEMRARPPTPLPGNEQFASLSRPGFTNDSRPDFAPLNQHLQSPVAPAEESSSIPLAHKRALELQKKSGPLEKAKNADDAMAIADVLVAELSPPIATSGECFDLESELWDLNKLEGTDEINRLGDGPYLQLVNAIMRYIDANHLDEAQSDSVMWPDQGVVNHALGQAMTSQHDRSAGISRLRASRGSRQMAQELVADALRNGAGVDQAVATAIARYSLTHPGALNELRQVAVHLESIYGPRADSETLEAASISIAADMGNGALVAQAIAQAVARHGLTHRDDLEHLRQVAAGVESTLGPRADVVARDLAQLSMTSAMRGGANVENAVAIAAARYSLTHPADMNELRQLAARIAANGGPRADIMDCTSAEISMTDAMRNGASVEDAVAMAVAQYGLTHADDLNELRRIAVRLASNGGPSADAMTRYSAPSRMTNAMRNGDRGEDVVAVAVLTATNARRNGTTVQDPVATTVIPYGLTANDLNDAWRQRAAALTASGLRASSGTWMAARDTIYEDIRAGATADDSAAGVIQLYGMAHPDDLNAIRQYAARCERDRH